MNIFIGFSVLSLVVVSFAVYSSTIPYTNASIAIFLAIVLLAGTIALSSPSFMTTGASAQAEPYYGIDKKYNSYGPTDYGMDKGRKLYGIDSYEPEYPSYKPDGMFKYYIQVFTSLYLSNYSSKCYFLGFLFKKLKILIYFSLSESYSAKKTSTSSSIQTKFIRISIVLITILLFSTIPHSINAFKSPIHGDITDESLGFLLSDVLDKISSTSVDVDETNKGSKFHLHNCDFQNATENINSLYDQLVPNIRNNIDAPETFGLLLHPVQDFYAHSNWIELGRNDLIDNGDGKWIVLKPFQKYKGVIIVQVGDKNDIPEGYTISENGKVVDVSSQSGSHPGLISGTVRDKDSCPEDVSLDHDILHKDNSDRPGYDKARALAKAQTIHEWCRLTNLVEQSYGQDGVQLLFNSWVDDKDKANSACTFDNSQQQQSTPQQNQYSGMQMTDFTTQPEREQLSIITQE